MNSTLRKIGLAVVLVALPMSLALAECNGKNWAPNNRYRIKESLGDIPKIKSHSRYKIKTGEVFDTKTKLIWQRCAVGMTWAKETGTCTGKATQMRIDDALARYPVATGKDWRLPSKEELASLRSGFSGEKSGCWLPAINATAFPGNQGDVFWSSSVYAGYSYPAWLVDFNNGVTDTNDRNDVYSVRLVRARK